MVKMMAKLDTLIQELCPQGVKRKRLGDIGTIVRGNGLQKKILQNSVLGASTMDRFILTMVLVHTKQNHL